MSQQNNSPAKPKVSVADKILKAESLNGKYTQQSHPEMGLDLNILDAFQQFLDDEQFEDEQLVDEFTGPEEESFFLDWLRDKYNLDEGNDEILSTIWTDLTDAYNERETPEDEPVKYYWSKSKEVKNFNIEVDQSALDALDKEMEAQAPPLKAGDYGDLDKSTLSILQIGRQNHMPLFMWLADAFNRYRLQSRKEAKARMKDKEFVEKFEDKTALEFVQNECKGFEAWLQEYQLSEQTRFREKCQSAISVYFRRILIKPPMLSRRPPDTLIEDSLLQIGGYMMQMYALVDNFCLYADPNLNHANMDLRSPPIPYQLDVVIIPKKSVRTDDDDYSDDDDDKSEGDGEIGDIRERLEGENFQNVQNVSWESVVRVVRPLMDTLVNGQKFQRSVLIIDRRGKDEVYLYKPSDKLQCCMFEQDQTKFLPESLLINSRECLIPPLKEPKDAKPISTVSVETNPSFLTLQFHVYSADETRVYLSYDGWGTRFDIEDLRYYLPGIWQSYLVLSDDDFIRQRTEFFVEEQRDSAKSLFSDEKYKDYQRKYEDTRGKCPDERFDNFYQKLVNAQGNNANQSNAKNNQQAKPQPH